MTDWQPIETAPKDGTVICLAGYCDDDTWAVGSRWFFWADYWRKYREPFGEGFGRGTPAPTHWMPLPPPPTAEKEE